MARAREEARSLDVVEVERDPTDLEI